MALLTNSIGQFLFDDLAGNVTLVGEQLEVFKRPGIEAWGALKTGKRSEKSTLNSILFVADWTAVGSTVSGYKTLIGADLQEITQNSVPYGAFLILNVMKVSAVPVMNAAGTLNTDPQVRLECQWTIIR